MIKLIKSTFYHEQETKNKLVDFIRSADFLSMGEQCREFEESFAKKQNRKHAIYVNSGSMANLVLIQALLNLGKIKKGDKIGVSALTWATNIMPLVQLGLQPVPIDCEVETLNVSPQTLSKSVGEIDALFITNVLGLCDQLSQIQEMCKANNILLIEDNCESLGSKINGRLLGNFGLASTFSFFVGHHLSTIEGGMIVTDDDEMNKMLVMVRAHGWDRNLTKEEQESLRKEVGADSFYAKYFFYDLAYNARPTEINGFLGNIQIQYWDEIIRKREDNYQQFNRAVHSNDDLIPIENTSMDILSSFALPIICKSERLCQEYKEKFEKIAEVRPIIAGDMTKQPFYKKYIKSEFSCKNANFVHENGFYIGNNPELTEEEMSSITTLLSSKRK